MTVNTEDALFLLGATSFVLGDSVLSSSWGFSESGGKAGYVAGESKDDGAGLGTENGSS